jgi:hypothetical protein
MNNENEKEEILNQEETIGMNEKLVFESYHLATRNSLCTSAATPEIPSSLVIELTPRERDDYTIQSSKT